MKRRLIVCCDGTWQDLSQICPTNVIKMIQGIKPVDNTNDDLIHQIVYYDEGLGTKQIDTKISLIDTLIKLGGGALGLGIDHKIQDAYRFLCLNYEPEDEIYLLGFSRGAYTVRCLAGLIYNCGLLQRQFIREVPNAYEIYREKQNPDNSPNGKKAINFRRQYGQEVPIKALCCWDTVASLGLPNLIPLLDLDRSFNERYRFFDHKINPTVENAFHAVAIDEMRKVFDVTLMESSGSNSNLNQITQVWFPGEHGSVGGAAKKDPEEPCQEQCGLSDGALLWMMEQVEKLGLALDKTLVGCKIHPKYDAFFDNRVKPPFNAFGTHLREVKGSFEDLHESVKKRWKNCPDYRPKNLMKFQQKLDAWSSPENNTGTEQKLLPV